MDFFSGVVRWFTAGLPISTLYTLHEWRRCGAITVVVDRYVHRLRRDREALVKTSSASIHAMVKGVDLGARAEPPHNTVKKS